LKGDFRGLFQATIPALARRERINPREPQTLGRDWNRRALELKPVVRYHLAVASVWVKMIQGRHQATPVQFTCYCMLYRYLKLDKQNIRNA
jgi:hypothetical protein